MSGNINSGLSAVLKQLYPKGEVANSIYSDFPFLAMVAKDPTAGGDVMKVPIRRNAGANASRTASTAFAKTNVSTNKAFLVTRGHDYSVAYILREDWKASLSPKGNKGGFIDICKGEVDSQINELNRRLNRDLYRSGSGSIGRTSSVSGTSLTLTNASDARYFEPDRLSQLMIVMIIPVPVVVALLFRQSIPQLVLLRLLLIGPVVFLVWLRTTICLSLVMKLTPTIQFRLLV